MQHLLTELTPLVKEYGLWIIFFGMMIEGTTMIIIAGILCYLGMLPLIYTIIVAILGAITGDQFWYFIGKNYAKKILLRFPSLQPKIKKIERSVKKRGTLLAFSGRFVYGGAILFPFTLGVYRFFYKKFTIFNSLGIIIWSIVGISLGYILGTGAEHYFGKIEKIWHFVLIAFVLFLITIAMKRYYLTKINKIKKTP